MMLVLSCVRVLPMPRFAFLLRLPVVLLIGHVYVAARLMPALPDGSVRMTVATVLFCMYVFIMAGFIVRHSAGQRTGDVISWAGFIMLGLFSWLFVLTLLRDVF